MFAINLTYNQVLDIVRDIAEAERLVLDGGPAGRSYYQGQSDAYRSVLRSFFDTDEIAEMISEVTNNENGGV